MKRLLLAVGLILAGLGVAHADPHEPYTLAVASYTAGPAAETTALIDTNTVNAGHLLHAIVVSSAGVGSGTSIKFYDSRSAASGLVANIDGTKTGTFIFDVTLSSGATYTTSGTTIPTVTFVFYKRRDR